jgi:hypothetical protein
VDARTSCACLRGTENGGAEKKQRIISDEPPKKQK